MRRPAALLPLGLAALGLAGCTTGFSYISRNYVALTPQVVTIGCKEPYEVYDNRQMRRMLIVSNALREYTGCNLSEARIDPEPDATRVKRFRTAARAYLDETVREDCRITGETVFDPLKTEFAYACDTPIEKRGTVVPRLTDRRRAVRRPASGRSVPPRRRRRRAGRVRRPGLPPGRERSRR